jgi:hypothetical protein
VTGFPVIGHTRACARKVEPENVSQCVIRHRPVDAATSSRGMVNANWHKMKNSLSAASNRQAITEVTVPDWGQVRRNQSWLGIAHTRNGAATAWIRRAGWCAGRPAGRTAADPRVRWGAGAWSRDACARSLLTSHAPRCSRVTLRTGSLLSQGRSACSCDQPRDQENVFQAHVITTSAHCTRCLHPS